MKAVVVDRYGEPDALRVEEVPEPTIGATDVLVRVHAASVNSWDRDNLRGAPLNRLQLGWLRPRVRVLGGDIAGTVDAVGPGVARFRPGDRVFGDLSASGWGAFAELARAPESALAAMPDGLGFEQAAAMPQAAVIALQGIRDYGQVHEGQRVLVNGAGGGAGSFAMQLAKARGAEVTGVDTAAKLDMLRGIGADHVLDYRATDYTATGDRYDVVLDCEVHRPVADCLRAVAPGGRLVVVGGDLRRIAHVALSGPWVRARQDKRMVVLLHAPNRDLAHLGQLAADGSPKAVIERTYALDEVPLAMQRMCDGLIVGKAVVRLR